MRFSHGGAKPQLPSGKEYVDSLAKIVSQRSGMNEGLYFQKHKQKIRVPTILEDTWNSTKDDVNLEKWDSIGTASEIPDVLVNDITQKSPDLLQQTSWSQQFIDSTFDTYDFEGAYEASKRIAEKRQTTDEVDGAVTFDAARAKSLISELKKDDKMKESSYLKLVEEFSKGNLTIRNNKILNNALEEISWDECYNKQNRVDESFASLAELQTSWDEVVANGEMTDEEGKLFSSIFQDVPPDATEHDLFDTVWNEENSKKIDSDSVAYAKNLIMEGKNEEAVYILKQQVKTNPNTSEGWRILGQLHADMEQDVEAIICLKQGHLSDPYNLDSLLALGVSLTNELDAEQALQYLKLWLSNHDDFQFLCGNENKNLDEKTVVTQMFEKALAIEPSNTDVMSGLGVLANINRTYDRAIKYFCSALQQKCNDATLWNKLGASLANSGKSNLAINAYKMGLKSRPNYPRIWANLAIAHSNLGMREDSIALYLNALTLNPKANHLWNYVYTALLSLGNYTLLEAADKKDISTLRRHFDGIKNPEELEKPCYIGDAETEHILTEIMEAF